MNIQFFLSTGDVASFLQKIHSISKIVSYQPYIERQVRSFCGLHALNHIFQKELFVYIEVGDIHMDGQLNLYAFERQYLLDYKKNLLDAYVENEWTRITRTLKDIPVMPKKPLKPASSQMKTATYAIARQSYINLLTNYNSLLALKKKYTHKTDDQIKDDLRKEYLSFQEDYIKKKTYANLQYDYSDLEPKENGNFSLEVLLAAIAILHYPVQSYSWSRGGEELDETITPAKVLTLLDDPNCIGILINKANYHYGAVVLTIPGHRYCFADPYLQDDTHILTYYDTSAILLKRILAYSAKKLCCIFLPV